MCYLHFCGTSSLMNKSWKPWWIRHATPRQTKLEARCQRLHLQVPTHLPRGWRAEVILDWFVENYKDSMGYPAFFCCYETDLLWMDVNLPSEPEKKTHAWNPGVYYQALSVLANASFLARALLIMNLNGVLNHIKLMVSLFPNLNHHIMVLRWGRRWFAAGNSPDRLLKIDPNCSSVPLPSGHRFDHRK